MPSAAQLRVIDPILTNHVRGYSQGTFIGDQVLPIATMPTRAAKRIEFGREAFKRYLITRAPGGRVAEVQFGYEGKPVALTQSALAAKTPVEHQQEAQQVPGFDLLRIGVDLVMSIIALEREIQQATAVRNAASYAATNKVALVGGAKWTDPASDPGKAVDDAGEVIRSRTGRRPNTLTLSAPVRKSLKRHPKILEQFKHTNSRTVNDAMLAEYFDIEKILVGDAIVDDGAGVASNVWGNDAHLAFVDASQTPNINIPSFGYTYRLAAHPFAEAARYDGTVRSWMNDVFDEWSAEVVGADAGFLFQNAV